MDQGLPGIIVEILEVIRSNFMDRNFSLKKTQLCHLQQVIQIFSLPFLSLKRE